MDIKYIVVRQYLESLKESEELDYIFPLFLESQGFIILSKPTESKGLSQYGKDVIAVGKDFGDGVKKRFYFEMKGGSDRHITSTTYSKEDGIRDSLIEAKDKTVSFINKEHEKLPLKIVLVHNGEIKLNAEEILKDFTEKMFPENGGIEFDRWGISELTNLFSEHFFGAFLLADKETTRLFNKTLVNLDANDTVSGSFNQLLDIIFSKFKRSEYKRALPRKWVMLFESLRLISFVIYTQAKELDNLEISKRYLTHLVLRFWHWILKNKWEEDQKIGKYIVEICKLYLHMMNEYFFKTLPVAATRDGLFSETAGKYEQVGYTFRTFNYLQYLCWYLRFSVENSETIRKVLVEVINANSVSCRPLLDIHSIPVISVLEILIRVGDKESAGNYLKTVFAYIKLGKEKYNRMPDAANKEKNVMRFVLTRNKPIDYIDSTSPLLAVLLEFTVILNMEEAYNEIRNFVLDNNIDLGIFIPHHGLKSTSRHFIEDKENDLEEQLFSKKFFSDGFQRETFLLKDNLNDRLSFHEFSERVKSRKDNFTYEYRTDKAGYGFLRELAHIYFRTPFFPDKWADLFDC